jgi:GNAT superfamily N-acetyltransferase
VGKKVEMELGPTNVQIRPAMRDDVPFLVQMLADDAIGATRERAETPLPQEYWTAFEAIDSDPRQALVVAVADDAIAGMLQLTFIPYLTHRGGERALIEGVRIAANRRGGGIGHQLLQWAIDQARERGCRMVQLTTDKRRPDARRFYESLGFVASHEGMKLPLDS